MENIFIKRTKTTPEVVFDFEQGIFKIRGVSIPEDAREFYNHLLQVIEAYIEKPKVQNTLIIQLDYFNSATTVILAGFIKIFEVAFKRNVQVNVQWYYEHSDLDMLETGKYLKSITIVPFQFIFYQEDED